MEIDFLTMFLEIFRPDTFLLMASAVLAGIIIGAIPGLTPTMGVALFIPLTFKMTAAQGLIFLGGIYTGSVYGGSIAAILINVPGAPASVATMFDGNPMAKRGEGERALYLSVLASGIGGVFGVILLMFFAPPLAAFSLKFGPAESFWMAIFGITIIASLSDKSVVKGILSGLFGLFLSTVGISTLSGTPRYTLGLSQLVGGIGLVAALIGVFALFQCLKYIEELYSDRSDKKAKYEKRKGSLIQALKDIKSSKLTLSISSVIGAIVGIVPGAGGQVAALMAYNESRRYSKKRDLFGTGHAEGIIAAESSNNAMVGSSLIPLLTLGIPGSPTAAVMLGGLLIHGLWPGPELFTTYGNITYTFMFGLMAAQIVMVLFGVLGAKYFSKVLLVPQHYLVPAIIVLCVMGSFATQNSYSDVILMVTLGLGMFFASKVGFDPAPLILGLILGSYAEEGLLLSIRSGEAAGSVASFLFFRPISMVLIGLCLISIVSTIWLQFKKMKNADCGEKDDCTCETAVSGEMTYLKKLTVDRVVSVCLIALAGILLFASLKFPEEVATFPRVIMISIILLGTINIFSPHKNETRGSFCLDSKLIKWFALILVLSAGYVFAIQNIGFYTSTIVYLILLPGIFRSKLVSLKNTKLKDMAVAVAFSVILYLVFTLFLNVPAPSGFLI